MGSTISFLSLHKLHLLFYYSLRVFHISISWWFLPGVWMTAGFLNSLLSILADFNNAVEWTVSTCPVISKSSICCTTPLVNVPNFIFIQCILYKKVNLNPFYIKCLIQVYQSKSASLFYSLLCWISFNYTIKLNNAWGISYQIFIVTT